MSRLLIVLYALLLLFPASGLAQPVEDPVVVRLKTGTYRGITVNETEQWLGIPYAKPPLGKRRFKPPVPLKPTPTRDNTLTTDASKFSDACAQPPSPTLGAPVGEDCLYLNVWRPENTPCDAKLPVLVWFPGGAYTSGSASEPQWLPTRMLQRSAEMDKPIIYVTFNHRLNTFGFLASSTIPEEDLNMGIQDQIAALKFVQQNIAEFGGDPEKVTLWGQSAGGGSVQALLVYLDPEERLFRAGIGDSATGPFKSSPPPNVYDRPGMPFDRLLRATNCTAGPEAIDCLRDVPSEKLMNISNQMIVSTFGRQLWQPTIAPGNLLDIQASERIRNGDFLSYPYLAGTNLNEGSVSSVPLRNKNLTGAAQNAAFNDFHMAVYIDNSTITQQTLLETDRFWAENDTSLGAPFNTGDSLFDRASAWYTDVMFLAPRRLFFENAASKQDLFAYHFREFIPGNDPSLGIFHTSELRMFFGPLPEVEEELANQMTDFYLNFIYDLNPGPEWPKYDLATRPVLQLLRGNVTVVPDDWDAAKTEFLNSDQLLKEYQK
ncbi:alpha/beta-hydrolase [Marasmius fiardii PR-910]|nr:alpha/beta-hydrolase [Marasmius fiardii PR-910]